MTLQGFLYSHAYYPAFRVLSRTVPEDKRWNLPCRFAQKRLEQYLIQKVGSNWFTPVSRGPAMTKQLRLVTSALNERSIEEPYCEDRFFFDAYRQMYHYLRLLEDYGFNLRRTGAVLEFGCGSARLLRLFRCIDGLRVVGSDVRAQCVDWCVENLPGAEFYVNQPLPPLDFAHGNDFDLVIAFSVFTHIPLEHQAAWLEEIRRVLRPGGILLCTVHGKLLRDSQLDASQKARLRNMREIELSADDPGASLSTRVIKCWDVYQTRERIIEVFGGVLQLVDYIPHERTPGGQDVLILKKT